jgi:DNA repair protein RecO (recombination protein O)
MALSQDRAICLRRLDYSETSQILLLFMREHGLMRLIAKGAHRRTKAGASKFDGGLDLLDTGNAVFIHSPEKDLSTLTEWGLIEGHLDLRKSLRPTYLAQYSAELVAALLHEHDPHPELFDRLERTLIDLQSPRREEIFMAFELDLLREAGFLPSLRECCQCGREIGDRDATFFSPARSGLVCRNCEAATPDRVAFDARLARLMQSLLRTPARLPQLTRHQTDPINRLLAEHIEHTLSKRLRLARYVLEPARAPLAPAAVAAR